MTVTAPRRSADRTKVAILGGGCGGLAAAWSLSETPALRERFDVTVYQLGWQLGGKGASSRAALRPDAPDVGRRIYEHGLHIWFGFYAHAFRMLKGAYDVAGLASGEDWWKVAFDKCDAVSLYEQRPDQTWVRQSIRLPRRGGADRGPPTGPARDPLGRVLARTARLLAVSLRNEFGNGGSSRGAPMDEALDQPALVTTLSVLDQIADEIDQFESQVDLGLTSEVDRRARGILGRAPSAAQDARGSGAMKRLTETLLAQVNELRSELQRGPMSDRIRLWCGSLEIVGASLVGIVVDDVLRMGFAPLDNEDLREWLKRHGAREETLAQSPVLRGLYDLTFAYRGGDKNKPSLAAGRGLQSLLLMINYEGSFMWRMRAGMGDTVFAPMYLALTQRGVRFHFFSRVTGLRLAPARLEVGAIDLTKQRSVSAGDDHYQPLEWIDGWWCWPETPFEDQLQPSKAESRTLTLGTDFDEVVLAIPVGALREICPELSQASPRFRQMLAGAETVRTKAMQIWLTRPISDLVAVSDTTALDPPATAHAEPFDTYCDMSHLIEVEGSDAGHRPSGVAYFCAVLTDGIAATGADDFVRAEAIRYLEREAAALWPAAFKNGRFDWDVLFDPLDRSGPQRLAAQYIRANVSLTDRYVTTPAGSVDSRLDPEDSGFDNLVLAGDWTHSGIDGGCVEAAVISGERAAAGLVARRRPARPRIPARARYIEYGALATAPGPLLCERARLYCFFVRADHARVQHLCDRVLKQPTGGALRYHVPRFLPVVLSFGTIAGLRSLHPDHAGRGSASEPEAAIWVPTIAQRLRDGRYEDQHLAIFMPYIWVDDPIALATGREVYGYPKTQGWMLSLEDPRLRTTDAASDLPDPPDELVLDVHGTAEYSSDAELHRQRLMTLTRQRAHRSGRATESAAGAGEGNDLESLFAAVMSELDPAFDHEPAPAVVTRSLSQVGSTRKVLAQLFSEQVVRQVFLKQVRDVEQGDLAALQQVVEARSTVTPGTLRWRRLRSTFDLSIASLVSQPLEEELGLVPQQTVRLAFVTEFGFQMEAGTVRWPTR